MAAKGDIPQTVEELAQSADTNWAHEVQKDVEQARSSTRPALNASDSILARKRAMRKAKKKAKDESLLGYICTQICEHQLGLSINLVLLLFLAHVCFPRARRRTSKFFHLSYYNEETGLYGGGTDDLSLVALWIVIFTGLRVAVMDYVLLPLATAGDIQSRKGKIRFAEQAWLLIYTLLFFGLDTYNMYHSEYWMDVKGLWTNWPIRELDGLFKWYYLVQFAFYLQQILVVNIEEKRKDYSQMFVHHIITSALIFLSYGNYHTRVGNVILCLMDSVDIFLPAAKLLKYLGYTTAPDIAFGIFMVVWVAARHVFYLMICWSIYADTPNSIAPGCYLADGTIITPSLDPVRYDLHGGNAIWRNVLQVYLDPHGPVCWNQAIRWSFLGLLLTLHGIILVWFAMIVRVAWKVISGNGADDVRSDDEGEEEYEEADEEDAIEPRPLHFQGGEKDKMECAPLEEDVGVESLNFSRRTSPGIRSYKRSNGRGGGGRASGISIPGHGDRKELLGRIGCDKPS